MAGDEEQRAREAGGGGDVRQHEDEARRARTGAEAQRAETEREDELGESSETGTDEDSVVPADTDAERRGVMPQPGETDRE